MHTDGGERPTSGFRRLGHKRLKGRSEFNSSCYCTRQGAAVQCPPKDSVWGSG